MLKVMIKILNLKLVIVWEYQNTDTFLQKVPLQIDLKKLLLLKKLKILYHGQTLLVILMVKKLLERFTKKNCKKQIKKNLESKKQSREKVINLMSNGKAMIIRSIVGLIKKCYIK